MTYLNHTKLKKDLPLSQLIATESESKGLFSAYTESGLLLTKFFDYLDELFDGCEMDMLPHEMKNKKRKTTKGEIYS